MKNIYAGFCGVGKSTLILNNKHMKIVEFECWKYRGDNFPDNYIKDILNAYNANYTVLISTDRVVINNLNSLGIKITLVYPDKKLKEEYIEKYKNRGSHKDFMNVIIKYWEKWIIELEQDKINKHIIFTNKDMNLSSLITGNNEF